MPESEGYKPTKGMIDAAKRGLELRKKWGRGGTAVGVARARDIVNNATLSPSTIKRMHSFFSRHANNYDKHYNAKESDNGPTAFKVAWLLWGGNPGRQFAASKAEDYRSIEEERPYPNEHAARLVDPDEFDDFRREKEAGGSGVDFIYGIADGESRIQSIRFDASVFSEGEARDWLDEHDFEPIKFEPAVKERTMEDQEIAIEDQVDEVEEIEVAEETVVEEDVRFDAEEVFHRSIEFDERSIDVESRRVKIALSSEAPVERSFGTEILDHGEKSIDMQFLSSGRAPLLIDHDHTKVVGVIEDVSLDGRCLRAVARFGKGQLASEILGDVEDGIRSNISIGYRINKMSKDSDGSYRAMSWTPLEASFVSVPADTSVGLGRSEQSNFDHTEPKPQIQMETKVMSEELNLDAVRDEAARRAAKDTAEMYRLAEKHNKRQLADEAVKEGKSLTDFCIDLARELPGGTPLETAEVGLSKKEVRNFSLLRAIRAMANPSDRQAQRAAEFEFEVSSAAQAALGREARGLMIPDDILGKWSKRDINTSDDAGLIAEDFRGGDFIDVLRNASSVMAAGATMLQGLQGSVAIPKKTAASTAGWIATEGGAASESEPTFGQTTLAPKVVGAVTDITRLMMHQSSPDIEALIRNDLSAGIALAIDDGALEGSGSSGQPTGIKNTSGINAPTSFAGVNPTFAEVVAMETAVAEDNALLGNLAYILPASMYGALKTTAKDSGSGQFVVEPGGTINGYRAIVSNQVTAGDLYFGNFADCLIGMYGGLDITVDPYSSSNTGTVRIVALQTCDVAVRHAVSFAVNNDGA